MLIFNIGTVECQELPGWTVFSHLQLILDKEGDYESTGCDSHCTDHIRPEGCSDVHQN